MAESPDARNLVASLSLDEKTLLIQGRTSWHTHPVPRLGLPSILMTDGPHGVRTVRDATGGLDITDNEKATAFPTAATVASSWDPALGREMGVAIAAECGDLGVHVLLAPGINIKRGPLCGRNFEYYSEDPLVSAEFGAAFVEGVQSYGIGCSLKHFAANSNENFRFYGDSVVDERALREIYLRAFERVVKRADPWTVMCSYNQLNGTFASENHWLLTRVLRDEWGFAGLVMTDWGATSDRVAGVAAGCDLEMPGGVPHNRRRVSEAVESGALPVADLNLAAARVVNLVHRCTGTDAARGATNDSRVPDARSETRPGPGRVYHEELAARIATESAVLLSNRGALPINPDASVLAVGELYDRMRFQGAGSSLVNPPHLTTARDALAARGLHPTFAHGYRLDSTSPDIALEEEALHQASRHDVLLVFAGLTDYEESEGFDREHQRLAENQTRLIEKLAGAGHSVVLILFAGAPVTIPAVDRLAAVLTMYLPGMSGGEAVARLVLGEQSPSGKLTETWLSDATDSSCAADYDIGPTARYYESIYVGYRYYEKSGTEPQFPFGHGLSYTTFSYHDLSVMRQNGDVRARLTVENSGTSTAAEVVQLYVRNDPGSSVFKADKELRAFRKVWVPAGESRALELEFREDELAYWNVGLHRWVLENGAYEICVGASSSDIRLTAPLEITSGERVGSPYSATARTDYAMPPARVPESFAEIACLGESSLILDSGMHAARDEIDFESPLTTLGLSAFGRLFLRVVDWQLSRESRETRALADPLERETQKKNAYFLRRMLPTMTYRSLCMASGGTVSYAQARALLLLAKGRPLRALVTLLRTRR